MIHQSLIDYMNQELRHTPTGFRRYMWDKILWDERLVGLVGPRGVGKSTMVKQYMLTMADRNEWLYVSADHSYFVSHSLADLAADFVREGGRHLVVDEIHKYHGWSQELKQIYDVHADLHVVFTGSSVLEINKGQADLSRRALMYTLQGLSFREFLLIRKGIEAPVFSIDDIIKQRVTIPELPHPLPYFNEYLTEGYYPFAEEPGFYQRLNQIVVQTVEIDIAHSANLRPDTARKLERLLEIVSGIAPYKPNFDNLAQEVGVSKNNVPSYLVYLGQAGMLGLLRDNTHGMRALGKMEKVYVDNTTLMYALTGGKANIGSVRETFFYNQMRVRNLVTASRESDFYIKPYTFEVGGMKKGKRQIENVNNGIIVKDDIETGHGSVIPLWYFGMNY